MSAPHQLHPLDVELPKHVEEALAHYLSAHLATIARTEESFVGAVDALTGFVLGGGKRIRPTFAWWGWRAGGGDPDGPDTPAVLTAISSLELVQACALVHDDLMDASATRRGAPTVHVAFAGQHRAHGWLGQPERFGLAAALLIGDLALAWADDMLQGSGLPAAALERLRDPWHGMRTEMLAGQYLDMLTQARGESAAEVALRIARHKTAAYTVERPLQLGAAMAGGSAELVAGLRRFGADLGVAFQLRDDLLGVFGDPAITGKPAGDDLREGKRTLLVALGLDRAGAAEAARLRGAIGRADLTESDVAGVRALLVEVGAVDAVEQRITELTDSAMDALHATPVAEPAATRLAELAVSVTKRTH
ncbi:polyprenyl synthetase family protein [Goodfellowiella coeruleoviolacea]|uniref:Geranylgeranyl diphosphate synthase, type I n=1 Tax=Goodfellowiella coeruleoviolacea TaxID=334858 RepID=A0AAE3KFV1_9PSEU|nr:polyprenyl synthetase family protein [Goodfellowiella coeruleoviolacea]MCP2165337.1 geranylgeranyl diphosphate synthase, type I [Goodfellowiella coeruleoviolacea]